MLYAHAPSLLMVLASALILGSCDEPRGVVAVQPRMANVNAKDVVNSQQIVDTGTTVKDWAPASAVGHNDAHIWSKDGALLCEAK